MGRIIRFIGLVLSISAFTSVPGSAQQTDASLVVGWAQLDGSKLEGNYLHATVLLPKELMRSLAFVQQRHVLYEEKKASAEKGNRAKMESASAAVALARRRRDLLALTVRDEAKRAAELLSAESSIHAAEALLAELVTAHEAANTPDAISPPDPEESFESLPLVPWSNHKSGSLVDPVLDPAVTCEKEKIDVLIYGSAAVTGNFISFDIVVYLASVDKVVWQGREYASPDGLDMAAEAYIRPVAEAVLGRSYALVTYGIHPPAAVVTIDGKPVNTSSELFLEDGEHELVATAVGYKTGSLRFVAQTGSDSALTLKLEPQAAVDFILSSEPPGARIHIDGSFVGITPVDIAGADFSRVARTSLAGFQDEQITIKPDALLNDIHLRLIPSDGLAFNDRFDSSKDRFYSSLGYFIMSLPVTVISGGLFQTYYNASVAASELYGGSIDESLRTRLNTGFYTTQALFWVSATASFGLAVNAGIRLVSYIHSTR